MIAAAAAIEEVLAALTAGTEATAAGATRAGAGLNDLERSSASASKALGKDFVKAIREALTKIDELEDAIVALKTGTQKYGELTSSTLNIALITSEAIKQQWTSMAGLTVAAFVASESLTKYAKASLKQNDLLVKGYQSLSEFGAIDSSGIRGVLDSAKRVGAVPENMEYMIANIVKHSEQLAIMGGTVAQGARTITNVMDGLLDPSKEFEKHLTNFGYTTEDIMKYGSMFVATNSRTLKNMGNDEAALKQQTYQYLEVLTELSELTGVSRDSQAKAAEELQQEIQWRQYLRELAKEPRGDEKVAAANAMMAAYIAKNGRELGASAKDILINNGATTAMSAQQAGLVGQSVNTIRDGIKNLSDIPTTVDKANKDLAVAAVLYLDQFGNVTKLSAEQAKALGISSKLFDAANYNMGDNIGKTKADLDKMKKDGDERLNAEASRKQAERALANYYQELAFYVGKVTVPAMEIVTQALIKQAKAINEVTPGWATPASLKNEFNRYEAGSNIRSSDATARQAAAEQTQLQQRLDALQTTAEQERQRNERNRAGNNALFGGAPNPAQREQERLQRELEAARKKEAEARAEAQRLRNQPSSTDTRNMTQTSAERDSRDKNTQRLEKIGEEFKRLYPNARVTSTTGGTHVPGSLHPEGRAMDISLGRAIKADEFAKMEQKLKELGASNVRNESTRPQKGQPGYNEWSGPHIHYEIPRELNGTKSSMSPPTYTPDDTKLANANNKPVNTTTQSSGPDNTIVVSKLDDLYTLFGRSLRVQEDILSHTKMLA
jgi:hypothetical protein